MSTVVYNRKGALAPLAPRPPGITTHAQVRFIERYVDAKAARAARQEASTERAMLELLANEYPCELATYKAHVAQAVDHLKERLGTVPFPRYVVRIGRLSIVMVGDTCVTTLPRRAAPRPIRDRRATKQEEGWN